MGCSPMLQTSWASFLSDQGGSSRRQFREGVVCLSCGVFVTRWRSLLGKDVKSSLQAVLGTLIVSYCIHWLW